MDIKKESVPFFSVIVPAYNNEQDLRKCIESILTQSYTDFELIIVDDGSTDTTPEICDHFAERDSRVHVIHKVNGGVAAARNDGLFRARGKYIYYVDGDDWIAEQLLQEAVKVLNDTNPPDIFIFGYDVIQENGQSESYLWPGRPGLYCKEQLEKEVYPKMYHTGVKMRMGFISGSLGDKIIARELLREHFCRDTNLFIFEDLVCAYECIFFAKQVYFYNQSMYFYNRFSDSSMHGKYHADLFENSQLAGGYLRASLGGRRKSIDKQINRIEFDGLVSALYQEIQFGSSLQQSVVLLKRKMKLAKRFPVCRLEGLRLYEQCYILLLSFRLIYFSLFLAKILIVVVNRWKNWKYKTRSCVTRVG